MAWGYTAPKGATFTAIFTASWAALDSTSKVRPKRAVNVVEAHIALVAGLEQRGATLEVPDSPVSKEWGGRFTGVRWHTLGRLTTAVSAGGGSVNAVTRGPRHWGVDGVEYQSPDLPGMSTLRRGRLGTVTKQTHEVPRRAMVSALLMVCWGAVVSA